jgi:tetratricopeptide (TPR) repeat protein
VLFPLAAAAYLGTLVACAALLLRRARARDLVPAAALVLTQALWFSIPFAVRYFDAPTGVEPLDLLHNRIEDYFKWVALGHAAQYLWVTSYYARASGSWPSFPRYFGKVLASGVAIWTLPVLFFAPLVQGHYEYAGGLALLVASVVNIHHFVLDGAIWKLRNSRIASVLIRTQPEEQPLEPGEGTPPRRGWLRPLVWAAAIGGLAVGLGVLWLEDFAFRDAFLRRDYAGMNRVYDRMAWFGRDNSEVRRLAGQGAARAGDWETSLHALEAALAMSPDDSELHGNIAAVARRMEDPADAARHLRDALRLAPDARGLRNELAWMLATSGDPRIRRPEEAIGLAKAMVRDAEESDANSLDTLAAAYAAAGRFDEAIRVASQAAELAQEQGQTEMGEQIRARLALYRDGRAFLASDSEGGA